MAGDVWSSVFITHHSSFPLCVAIVCYNCSNLSVQQARQNRRIREFTACKSDDPQATVKAEN
jgi:hypothetical protein